MLDAVSADLAPDPGTTRQVAGPGGESVGIEVWTGDAWLRLRDVAWVSPIHPPRSPAIGGAHLTLKRVWPAALPWPGGRRDAH